MPALMGYLAIKLFFKKDNILNRCGNCVQLSIRRYFIGNYNGVRC